MLLAAVAKPVACREGQATDDNAFPNKKLNFLWETSGTMNHSWGYNRFDFDYRTPKFLLRALVDNISRNGNFQLNIGPRGDGSLPPSVLRRLRELAAWTSINQEAIYGTRPVDTDEPAWGRIVQKDGKVYLHLYDAPADCKLELLKNLPAFSSAMMLETQETVAIEKTAASAVLHLGKSIPDDRIAVIILS